jgi:integrase
MRGDGRVFKQKRSPFLSISYYHGTDEQREVALHVRTGKKLLAAVDENGKLIHDDNYKEAQRFLKHRVGQVTTERHNGPAFITPAKQRVTVSEILDALVAEFEAREKLTPQIVSHLKPIRAAFGEWRAVDLTAHPEAIDQYIKARRKLGKRKPTVNRGTQLLGQAYQLAVKSKTLTAVPRITRLWEGDNVRQGYLEESEFRRIYAHLPQYLADYAFFAYKTGWRKSAVASLRWADVHDGRVWLLAQESKNREGADVPVEEGEFAEIIARRQAARKVVNKDGTTTLCDLLFHHDGHIIVDYRKAWKTTCKLAGVSGKLFHDMCRSAAKNMDDAGVPRAVAKKIMNRKSDAMHDRYRIVSDKNKRDAVARTEQYLRMQREQAPTASSKAVGIN